MLGLTVFGLLAVGPAAGPVPKPPPAPAVAPADRNRALEFARIVYTLAERVPGEYANAVEIPDLIDGAIRGLYEEVGREAPAELRAAVGRTTRSIDLVNLLADARVGLGNPPALAGPRSLFAAIGGFRYATDPLGALVGPRIYSYASVDMDFGVGLELAEATGTRWTIYQVERGVATGAIPAVGMFGPIRQPNEIPPPAAFPWAVKRVVPGSPAQKAGVKPGDIITHLNGAEVTPGTAARLFAQFADPPGRGFDPATGQPLGVKLTLTLKRAGQPAGFPVVLETGHYVPECAWGVIRTADDRWDAVLDREHKIGYARVGPVEMKADEQLDRILAGFVQNGGRGLILDLRWCPGGYVAPALAISGLFLKQGAVIARTHQRNPGRSSTPPVATNPVPGKYLDIPLVVLVGSETIGGGELIAAALQDNARCVVLGQRTAGRASIQYPIDAGFGGLQYKITTGTSFRPNGKPRIRTPQSQPTDDWGIRPDAGLEVPVTADVSAELRRWADLHALRPASSREALAFDDPMRDPYRLAALAFLRKKLGR